MVHRTAEQVYNNLVRKTVVPFLSAQRAIFTAIALATSVSILMALDGCSASEDRGSFSGTTGSPSQPSKESHVLARIGKAGESTSKGEARTRLYNGDQVLSEGTMTVTTKVSSKPITGDKVEITETYTSIEGSGDATFKTSFLEPFQREHANEVTTKVYDRFGNLVSSSKGEDDEISANLPDGPLAAGTTWEGKMAHTGTHYVVKFELIGFPTIEGRKAYELKYAFEYPEDIGGSKGTARANFHTWTDLDTGMTLKEEFSIQMEGGDIKLVMDGSASYDLKD